MEKEETKTEGEEAFLYKSHGRHRKRLPKETFRKLLS